jgi:molybdopterin synthase catalytic subunit
VISVRHEDFDAGAEIRALHATGTGAVVSFTGLVRDYASSGDVSAIELEHYPAMTAKSLAAIEIEARQRWPLLGVTIIHRIGRLAAGEQIVLVVVSSAHRQAAFDACAFLMDYLKTRAPFWKKEWVNGQPHWVEAKADDQNAAAKWARSE